MLSRMASQEHTASVYAHPQYWDLALRSETRLEAHFIEEACRGYVLFPVRRLLEPGCGSGRLVVELARRGYAVSAFDRCRPALRYLRRKLARRRLIAEVFEADLAEFRLLRPVDAAFCTFNTFRHLTSEADARRHLECVAKALRPGGIYILGLHLLPLDVAEEAHERWTARRGRTQVTATLRVLHFDRQRRLERLRLSLRVRAPGKDLWLKEEFDFRIYTAGQLRRLLRSVPAFTILDVFDFWYEIDKPLRLNDELVDTVLVLGRT
jgi:SAM-dependent methyltransferase